jgi:hypothetical protein
MTIHEETSENQKERAVVCTFQKWSSASKVPEKEFQKVCKFFETRHRMILRHVHVSLQTCSLVIVCWPTRTTRKYQSTNRVMHPDSGSRNRLMKVTQRVINPLYQTFGNDRKFWREWVRLIPSIQRIWKTFFKDGCIWHTPSFDSIVIGEDEIRWNAKSRFFPD